MNIEVFLQIFCGLNFTCQLIYLPTLKYIHYVIDAVSLNAVLELYAFRVTCDHQVVLQSV